MTSRQTNPHRQLYDGIAEWYVRTFYGDMSDGDWLKLMIRTLPSLGVVADVGSGPAQYARIFRDQGYRVVSIDIAERMLAVGGQIDPDINPVAGDICAIPLVAESLVGLIAAYTLEHVSREHAAEAFRGMSRVLAVGGVVALMVKCGQGSYEFHSTLVPGARGYVQLWELDELSRELAKVGCTTLFKDMKAPVSPEEFDHQRGFILARKVES
jgi:SAM-dependent methyltransferase